MSRLLEFLKRHRGPFTVKKFDCDTCIVNGGGFPVSRQLQEDFAPLIADLLNAAEAMVKFKMHVEAFAEHDGVTWQAASDFEDWLEDGACGPDPIAAVLAAVQQQETQR